MKKKLIVLGAFMMIATFSFSQFEVKFNPIGALFGQIPVSAEYVLNDNMGVEASVGYYFKNDALYGTGSTSSRFVGILSYKYYFSPDQGGDKFYVFPYARYKSSKYTFDYDGEDITGSYTAVGVGFGIGYKWVSDGGILVDLGMGAGKNFSGGWDYSDPTYSTTLDIPVWPINFVSRISIGYRF